MAINRHCHKCGLEYTLAGSPGRSESCLCGADLHCCLNCVSYDARAAEQWVLFRGDDLVPPARVRVRENLYSNSDMQFRLPKGWSVVTPYPRSAAGVYEICSVAPSPVMLLEARITGLPLEFGVAEYR